MTDGGAIGILGGGLIGMSWASLFLAHGADVIVVDPQPDAADTVKTFVAEAWPHLAALGLTTSDSPKQAQVSTDMAALAEVTFLQENAPDRIDIKRALIGEVEQIIGADVLIASSTSSLMASDIQSGAQHPERILVAHPMNPPHMVPMIELVAGRQTAPETVDLAEAFYLSMNRVPIRVRKEVPGHLANRLTAALYREAVHLAAEGIADVADIDKAIAYGPGMRWALMGPHLTYHLGGGAGGYRHYLDHLGPTQEARWQSLGHPVLSEQVKDMLVSGIADELVTQDETTLVQRRDAALVEMAAIKRKYGL